MSSFQDSEVFRSQKPWGRSPKELRASPVELQDGEKACMPASELLWTKTTSSVLSALLFIYGWGHLNNYLFKQ